MQQTIYGETLRVESFVEIKDQYTIKKDILSYFHFYLENIKGKKITVKNTQTHRDYLGLTNNSQSKYIDDTVKNILVSDIWSLEKFSMGLGDDLLNLVSKYFVTNPGILLDSNEFCEKKATFFLKEMLFKNFDTKRMSKEHLNKYISQMSQRESKAICKKVMDLSCPDEHVYLEKTNREKNLIRRSDKLNMILDFDTDFLMKKDKINIKSFKVVLIDGFIDSVGEI